MPTTLITGASRGIGLEFARQFSADGWNVIATCRDPSVATDLAKLSRTVVFPLDVDDPVSIQALRASIGRHPIDVLLNNAGLIGQRTGFGTIDYDKWNQAMSTNTFGPMRMAETFAPHVLASERKQMVFISTRVASFATAAPTSYIYRASKVALNMAVLCMSMELRERGITAVLLCPGHVRTALGGPNGKLSAEESVAGMKRRILELTLADSGRFLSHDGEELPW